MEKLSTYFNFIDKSGHLPLNFNGFICPYVHSFEISFHDCDGYTFYFYLKENCHEIRNIAAFKDHFNCLEKHIDKMRPVIFPYRKFNKYTILIPKDKCQELNIDFIQRYL